MSRQISASFINLTATHNASKNRNDTRKKTIIGEYNPPPSQLSPQDKCINLFRKIKNELESTNAEFAQWKKDVYDDWLFDQEERYEEHGIPYIDNANKKIQDKILELENKLISKYPRLDPKQIRKCLSLIAINKGGKHVKSRKNIRKTLVRKLARKLTRRPKPTRTTRRIR